MTKDAPSWYEHNSGEKQIDVPAATKDNIEFKDVTIELQRLTLEDLTTTQRSVYDRAFNQ